MVEEWTILVRNDETETEIRGRHRQGAIDVMNLAIAHGHVRNLPDRAAQSVIDDGVTEVIQLTLMGVRATSAGGWTTDEIAIL